MLRQLSLASLLNAVALRPRFRDVMSARRLPGGAALSRSRKECHRVSNYRIGRGVRARRLLPLESPAAIDDLAEIRAQIQQLKEAAHSRARGAPEGR
jgi:hypothetical protein